MLTLALLICAAAAADPVPQFGVTAVNAHGNSLYNVTLTPNATPNTGALITGTTQLNTRRSDAWQVLRSGPCSQLSHQRTRSDRRGHIEISNRPLRRPGPDLPAFDAPSSPTPKRDRAPTKRPVSPSTSPATCLPHPRAFPRIASRAFGCCRSIRRRAPMARRCSSTIFLAASKIAARSMKWSWPARRRARRAPRRRRGTRATYSF